SPAERTPRSTSSSAGKDAGGWPSPWNRTVMKTSARRHPGPFLHPRLPNHRDEGSKDRSAGSRRARIHRRMDLPSLGGRGTMDGPVQAGIATVLARPAAEESGG